MGTTGEPNGWKYTGLLQSEELYQYIMRTSIYPREPEPLKELREATQAHPMRFMGTSPLTGQLLSFMLKTLNPKKTIEVGVYTGYSLLLTALSIPDDGKITAIDVDKEPYGLGLPFIRKAGVEHKINYILSDAMLALDQLLQEGGNEGSFDFAFVDADKPNYVNYHEKLMKLIKVGGIIAYDDTAWGGTVAMPESQVPEARKKFRPDIIKLNNFLASDSRIDIAHLPLGDGMVSLSVDGYFDIRSRVQFLGMQWRCPARWEFALNRMLQTNNKYNVVLFF